MVLLGLEELLEFRVFGDLVLDELRALPTPSAVWGPGPCRVRPFLFPVSVLLQIQALFTLSCSFV